jgi:transcriptional regulator with XRE-family HTH domain
MSEIGRNIMIRRKEVGLTQEELATRMGYKSKSTINKIENGTNDIPQSKIVKFAEVLGTTPAALMGWEKTVQEKPVETANKLADLFLRIEFDDADDEVMLMLEEFFELDKPKKAQVCEYVHFLKERS